VGSVFCDGSDHTFRSGINDLLLGDRHTVGMIYTPLPEFVCAVT